MSSHPPADENPQSPRREPGDDVSKRTTAFVQIVALEAAIIVALWILGRMFS
jgi:hypothetical protein